MKLRMVFQEIVFVSPKFIQSLPPIGPTDEKSFLCNVILNFHSILSYELKEKVFKVYSR